MQMLAIGHLIGYLFGRSQWHVLRLHQLLQGFLLLHLRWQLWEQMGHECFWRWPIELMWQTQKTTYKTIPNGGWVYSHFGKLNPNGLVHGSITWVRNVLRLNLKMHPNLYRPFWWNQPFFLAYHMTGATVPAGECTLIIPKPSENIAVQWRIGLQDWFIKIDMYPSCWPTRPLSGPSYPSCLGLPPDSYKTGSCKSAFHEDRNSDLHNLCRSASGDCACRNSVPPGDRSSGAYFPAPATGAFCPA